MPAARACSRISRSTICSTMRPRTRQLRSEVVINDELIAVGGLVDACEGTNAGGASVLEDFAQHHMLDHAAEDAAAHQPGIDVPDAGGSGAADDDADHAVVAEGVGRE